MDPIESELVKAEKVVRKWYVRALAALGVFGVWAVGLAIVIVALGSLGVIWLSRQPAGSRLSISLANRALAQVSDMRLTARRSLLLEHGALLTDARLETVDSTGTRHPLLAAHRLEITTSWWGVVSRRPTEFRIVIDRPTVTLTRDAAGALVLPRFHAPPRTGKPATPLTFDLDVRGGTVLERTLGQSRVDTLARDAILVARAHGAGTTWDAALGRFSAGLPRLGLTMQKAEGQARLADGRLALNRLRMRTDAGWIELSGAGPLSPAPDVEVDVQFGEWRWRDIARLAHQDALAIEGGIAGRAHVRATRESIALTGVESDVLWRDEPVRARFDGLWSGGRLSLTDAHVAWRRATLDGAFTFDPKPGRWRLNGALAALDLSELPRLWPMPALEPVVVGGDVDFTGDHAGMQARVTGGSAQTKEIRVENVAGTWGLAGKTQRVDATAHAAGASLSAKGTLAPHALDAQIAVTGADAARLPASWWHAIGLKEAPAGRLESLSVRLQGPPERPQVQGTAVVSGVRAEKFAVDDAAIRFAGVLGKAYSVRANVRSGYAHVAFAEADSAEAQLVVAPTRIDLESFHAQRAESTLVAQGHAERDGKAWNLHVTHVSWDAGDRIALENDGPVEARIEADGAIAVEHVRVISTAGALTARGVWGGAHRASDLELDLESLDLEALLGALANKLKVRGVLTGKARLEGEPGHATWTVDLDATDLHYNNYTARRLFARGRFADEQWRIERLVLDTGRGTASFEGELDWAAPPPWSGSTADWNRALAQVPHWSGTLVTDSLAFAQIAEIFPQAGGWRGSLSLKCVVGGKPAAPEIALTGRIGRPGWGQATLADFDVDVSYRDELITVRKFAMVGPDSAGPALTGRLPMRLGWDVPAGERVPDRPMELVAFARGVDVGLVPLILPQIAAASGTADFDARLTGTPRLPLVNGQLTIKNAVARPASREEVLTGVNGTVRLTGGELRVERFEARQGSKGRLVVKPGGVAHFKNLRIADYALDVTASHFTAFASGEYVIEISGAFKVVNGRDTGGPIPLPHITGTANVVEGVFLINFADPQLQAASQGPAALPPWTYDIHVEARNNVWWRPAEANIEGKLTDFEIIQEIDRFVMLGTVESLQGRYYFLGNQFDVDEGTIFFDLAQPMNPNINATLTTEKPMQSGDSSTRETITLTVTGRAQEPDVNLTSSPTGLSQTEIAQLLTFGQIRGGGAGAAVGQATANYLVRQLMREVPGLAENLGYVEVGTRTDDNKTTGSSSLAPGSSNVKAYTTVGVSRYFTRDLLVRYSQVVGDVTQAQNLDYLDLGAEYRLSELLFLRGQVTRRKTTLTVTQDETIYNLDVRARHEY